LLIQIDESRSSTTPGHWSALPAPLPRSSARSPGTRGPRRPATCGLSGTWDLWDDLRVYVFSH
jgi:hypothetical protein